MGRPFTHVSSVMYYDLEIYFFKLALYTDSIEYSKLTIEQRNKVDYEILSMDNVLSVMRMFRQIPTDEKPILAWKKFRKHESEYKRIFRFSSSTTAAKCLHVHPGKVLEVCKGRRNTTGGYIFQFDEDVDETIFKKKKKLWFT